MNTVTAELIKQKIKKISYVRVPDTTVTVCAITMENGFVAVGHSACVEPSNFNEAVGQSIAYENAFQTLWSHEGYLLAQRRWVARVVEQEA